MKTGKSIAPLVMAVSMALISSCSNTKYLPKNESLYIGDDIHIKAPQLKKSQRKAIKGELSPLVRPKPNTHFLGMRPKLWLWNIAGKPKKKISLRRLIKSLGEPPVLASTVNLERNDVVLQNHLENDGFFNAAVIGEFAIKKRRATAVYTVEPGSVYKINDVTFQADSSDLQKAIIRTKRRTLLKKKAPFDLDVVKAERIRIDERLKNLGFYYFSPEYLLMDIDSTIGEHRINMYVNTKHETPLQARRKYRINDVVIYPTYRINGTGNDTSKNYGVMYQGYYVVDSSKFYKPKLFQQAMQFNKGDF
ncbi:MAG TPA: hypothetical protein VM101_13320, partial [Flavitalea sp.]|nr:hypothetical protein [Flavitalea sp.]